MNARIIGSHQQRAERRVAGAEDALPIVRLRRRVSIRRPLGERENRRGEAAGRPRGREIETQLRTWSAATFAMPPAEATSPGVESGGLPLASLEPPQSAMTRKRRSCAVAAAVIKSSVAIAGISPSFLGPSERRLGRATTTDNF